MKAISLFSTPLVGMCSVTPLGNFLSMKAPRSAPGVTTAAVGAGALAVRSDEGDQLVLDAVGGNVQRHAIGQFPVDEGAQIGSGGDYGRRWRRRASREIG